MPFFFFSFISVLGIIFVSFGKRPHAELQLHNKEVTFQQITFPSFIREIFFLDQKEMNSYLNMLLCWHSLWARVFRSKFKTAGGMLSKWHLMRILSHLCLSRSSGLSTLSFRGTAYLYQSLLDVDLSWEILYFMVPHGPVHIRIAQTTQWRLSTLLENITMAQHGCDIKKFFCTADFPLIKTESCHQNWVLL